MIRRRSSARIEIDAARADIAAALTDIAALPDARKTAGRRLGQESRRARGGHCGEPANRRRRARGAQQAGLAMIRIVLFLIVVGALSLGVAWLADRPGDVVITWQGLRIETSLMVLAAAVLAAMVVLALIWSLIRAILRSPFVLARHLHHRRGVRAYEAISNGLIAVGAGDIDAAQKHSAAVNRLAPGEPLALLLSAQSAQLAGDRDGAERSFRAMASRADTKALGLHGLFIEARRRNDPAGARAYAEEAVRTAPSLGWASRAVLESLCRDGDWAGALALLERNMRTFERTIYRRLRAVLLTARAHAIEDTDRGSAKAFALEAAETRARRWCRRRRSPAGCLAEGGQLRKANRVIDSAWRANPHPELAQAYAELRSGDSARDRLKRIEALAKQSARPYRRRAGDCARRARRAGIRQGARSARALSRRADQTHRFADGGTRTRRAQRRRPRPRMAGARAARRAGSGLDRRRPCLRSLAGGIAGDRAARCLRMARAAHRDGERAGDRAGAEPAAPDRNCAPAAGRKRRGAAPKRRGASSRGLAPSRRPRSRNRGRSPNRSRSSRLSTSPDDPGPEAVEESEPPAEPETGGWRKIFG